MSFFTTLSFYRSCSPPQVTGDDLSRFLARISQTNALTDAGLRLLHVKFGPSIDEDDEGIVLLEESAPGIAVMGSVDWDIELSSNPTLQNMIDALASDERRVYRAQVLLGMPVDGVLAPITRTSSPENEIDFRPDSLSVNIGPVECFNLDSEEPLLVGWISLDLSGDGYLFPWTFRGAVDRLQGSPEVQRLMEVCRSFWPVPSGAPDPEIVQLRERFRDLWPYDRFDAPWDWYWGLQETG